MTVHGRAFALATIAVLLILLLAAPQADASDLVIQSNGSCGPKGTSFTSWTGYPSSAWGSVTGNLAYNNGGSWEVRDAESAYQSGSSGMALVDTYAGYQAGNWQEKGFHSHSPSGMSNATTFDYFTCGGPW